MLPGARPAGRLGEQRPARLLGQDPRRRAGVVAGDHDGARAAGERGCARAPGRRTPPGDSGAGASYGGRRLVGDQRLVELHVQCIGPVGRGHAHRVVGEVRGAAMSRVRHRAAEDADLVGGLVGAGAAQPGGPVGGDGDQRARRRGRPRARPGAGWPRPCPEVHTTAAAPRCRASPRARKPADALVDPGVQPQQRRPRRRRRAANASGALREPGATTTSRTPRRAAAPARPPRASVRRGVRRRAHPAAGRAGHGARHRLGQPVLPVRAPGRGGGEPVQRGRVRTAGRTGSAPVHRQQRRRWRRRRRAAAPSPARRRAAARAARPRARRPAAMPTEVSTRRRHHHGQADVLGDPQAGAHPAQRLHLEHRDVGGLQVAHPVGVLRAADRLVGGDRHVDAAAHPGEVLDARAPAARRTPGRPRRGRAPGSRRTAVVDVPAAVGVDPDPPVGAERVAHRLQPRLRPRRGVWPGSATLTFAVRQPAARARSRGPARGRRPARSR